MLSLSLGDTRLLEEREKYELQTAGLSHLTSVSGTHLLFITGPSERFLKKLRLSSRMRTILMIFILFLPGILSGWKSGICRASLISLFRMADRPLMRRRDAYNTLFFVGSLLLLFNAFALYDTGFWMSLMTAAAVSFMSEMQDKKEGQGKKAVGSLHAALHFSFHRRTNRHLALPDDVLTRDSPVGAPGQCHRPALGLNPDGFLLPFSFSPFALFESLDRI